MSDRAEDLAAILRRLEAAGAPHNKLARAVHLESKLKHDGWMPTTAALFAEAPTDIAMLLLYVEKIQEHWRDDMDALRSAAEGVELEMDRLWAESKNKVKNG